MAESISWEGGCKGTDAERGGGVQVARGLPGNHLDH